MSYRGRFRCYVYDALTGRLRRRFCARNAVTDASLNDLLAIYFVAGAQKTSWYFALISNTDFTGLANSDTAASHAGWTESTDYAEATRPQWSPGAPAGGLITNPVFGKFTMNLGSVIKGLALISNNTKAGTTGLLFCTALAEGGDQTLQVGEVLKVYYDGTMARG